MHDIFTYPIVLDNFRIDIIEGARDYYKKNPPKNSEDTLRGHVEFWVENFLRPAIENAIEEVFGYEEEEDDA